MHFKSGSFLGKLVVALLIAAFAAPGAISARQPASGGKVKKVANPNLAVISRLFTTTNSVLFGIDNRGNIGKDPGGSSTTGGGYWRTRTDQYVFQSGLHVAGLFDANGDGMLEDTVETEAVYDEEWREGHASGGQDDAANHLYTSKSSSDLADWPEEFRENGEPKIYGQEDIVGIYTDIGGPVNVAAGSFRLGVETWQRLKIFSVTSQKDILYAEWRFKNVTDYVHEDVNGDGVNDVDGPYEIKDMLAVINTDFDIGDADDDRAAVSPLYNMAIYWDSDFSEGNFTNPVGFFGIKFLDSPSQVGRPADGVDNDGDGQVDEDGEPNRIGLTGFTITTNRGGPREDPNTDAEAYRIMVNAPGEVTEPQWDPDADLIVSDFQDDLRARLLTGPFDLPADGSVQKVECGYLFAEPLRSPADPNDITLDGELVNLVGLAQTVQTTFDTDFNLPAPPVSPNMSLIERDGMVIITWDDLPEKTPDPFYPVSQIATNPDGTPASTYNPDYLQYDFQGYRVYRSLTTNASDARLLGQFDKADGITSANASYIVQVGEDIDGDGSPDYPDVVHDPFDVGQGSDDNVVDAGVRYILVDRGQGLSNREGLINGVKYYYSVTAFDYQPDNKGQESLESGLQFVSLNSVGQNTSEGIPRTSANGFEPATVNGIMQVWPDDSEIGPQSSPSLDANGMLDATVQPAATNGLTINEVVIANGDASVLPPVVYMMVDSVINTPNDYDEGLGIYHDAQFDMFLHAEGENGNVLGSSRVSSKDAGWDPWGGTVEMEGTLTMIVNGAAIGSISYTTYADNWDGLVIEPIQIAGSIAYDNVQQGHQRTQLTNYFSWWLYGGFGDLWGVYADLPETELMPTIGSDPTVGSVTAGVRTADVTLTWVSDGSDLTLEVYDESNHVMVPANTLPNDGWGFVPKNRSALDMLIDQQTAYNMFDYWWPTDNPGEELIAIEETLADGSKRPYAVDDGRRNMALVHKLADALKPSDYDVAGREVIDPDTGDPDPYWPEIGDGIADLTGTQDLDLYVCGVLYKLNGITSLPSAGDVWKVRMRWGASAAQNPYRGGSDFPATAQYAHRRPVTGNKWKIEMTPEVVDLTKRDLKRIRVVPNPYIASSALDLTTNDVQLQFVNLPGICTIRIYTVAGHLVDMIEHTDGTGTESWGMRSRFNQQLASGYYIYHVEDHETGGKYMGKFAVIH